MLWVDAMWLLAKGCSVHGYEVSFLPTKCSIRIKLTLIHGSGRLAKKKNGEGPGALDVGGEGGPTAKTTHRTICLSTLPRLRTPDLSVLETTRLDQ